MLMWIAPWMRGIFTSLIAFLIVFAVIRIVSVPFMYYQDEYKVAFIVEETRGEVPHPPLVEVIYYYGGLFFGFDKLRFVPFVFSLFNAVLIFAILLRYFSTAAAFGGLGLLTISMWHILGSTMIDVDGAILPFFFLLAAYGFFRYEEGVDGKNYWFALSIFSAAAGILTKLYFGIFFPTLFVYLWWKNRAILSTFKTIAIYILATCVAVLLGFTIVKLIYPYFKLSHMFGYAASFKILNLLSRDYGHLLFTFALALLFASPLLPGVILWSAKNFNKKSAFFLSWIAMVLLFYLVLVDVSHRPLERYLMSLIFPMVILGGTLFQETTHLDLKSWVLIFFPVFVLSLIIGFSLNMTHAQALPLYPKTAYIEKLFRGNLNFYIPFTGGSGPMGFQLTALSVVVLYAIPLFMLMCGLFARSKKLKWFFLVGFLASTLGYNVLLGEEYLFSGLNPNVQKVASEAVKYVIDSQDIGSVITYNDIGAYELKKADKYTGRFYAVPEYFAENEKKFESHEEGKFLIVDFPHINRDGPYWQYLSKCKTLKVFEDKGATLGYIFDC